MATLAIGSRVVPRNPWFPPRSTIGVRHDLSNHQLGGQRRAKARNPPTAYQNGRMQRRRCTWLDGLMPNEGCQRTAGVAASANLDARRYATLGIHPPSVIRHPPITAPKTGPHMTCACRTTDGPGHSRDTAPRRFGGLDAPDRRQARHWTRAAPESRTGVG